MLALRGFAGTVVPTVPAIVSIRAHVLTASSKTHLFYLFHKCFRYGDIFVTFTKVALHSFASSVFVTTAAAKKLNTACATMLEQPLLTLNHLVRYVNTQSLYLLHHLYCNLPSFPMLELQNDASPTRQKNQKIQFLLGGHLPPLPICPIRP